MKMLLDLALLVIIAICVWGGYKKGLVMGIGGVLILIVSIVIGNILSSTYSQDVISAMRPFASGYTDDLLTDGVYAALGVESSDFSIEDLLAQNPDIAQQAAQNTFLSLGLHEDVAEQLAEEAVQYSSEQNVSLADAVTQVVCSRIAFAIGFLLFFLLSVIILTVIGNLTNLSFRIPYLGTGNEIGGAIAGFIEGLIFCAVIAWALRLGGILFPDGMLEDTWLLSFMMDKNLLTAFLGI
ncbi:MAG: CvpA family protein [Oscillospiraceae bacterium]